MRSSWGQKLNHTCFQEVSQPCIACGQDTEPHIGLCGLVGAFGSSAKRSKVKVLSGLPIYS